MEPGVGIQIQGGSLGGAALCGRLDGTLYETCTALPFGDQQACSYPNGAASDSPLHFTAKPRDPETGLDDFGARDYTSTLGRFLTPDWSAQAEPVPYADLENPQSLNLYEYAGNNPVSRTDLDGHCVLVVFGHGCTLYQRFHNFFSGRGWKANTELGAVTTSTSVLGLVYSSKPGSKGGPTAGQRFTPADKRAEIAKNMERNGGVTRCDNCGQETVPAQASRAGVTPSGNKTNIDHIEPRANGGNRAEANRELMCRSCNLEKFDSAPVLRPGEPVPAMPEVEPVEPVLPIEPVIDPIIF